MPLNNTTIPILRGNKQKAHPLQSGNQQRHQSSPRFDEVVDKRSSVFVCEAPILPTISRTLSLVGVAGSPRHQLLRLRREFASLSPLRVSAGPLFRNCISIPQPGRPRACRSGPHPRRLISGEAKPRG